MKTFKQYLSEAVKQKKTFYATCATAFNKNTGNRKSSKGLVPYRDATDFAQATTDDNNNNKDELKISKEEFLKHCDVHPDHEKYLNDPKTEYLHNKERDSHMMWIPKQGKLASDYHFIYEHQ